MKFALALLPFLAATAAVADVKGPGGKTIDCFLRGVVATTARHLIDRSDYVFVWGNYGWPASDRFRCRAANQEPESKENKRAARCARLYQDSIHG